MVKRDIIVIGASRGGLEALCRVASHLPAKLPAAIAIVLHTAPQSPRYLADILARYARVPVIYGKDGYSVRPNHSYIAPPDRHLIVVSPGLLQLDAGPKVRFSRPAADRLFETAAAVFGPRVIGVVMTGGDHDGTDGLKAIKASGGLSVLQDPADAQDPGMPTSALIGDDPDYCVPLDEIGPLLVDLVSKSEG